jgi:hypothetical protein
MNKKYLWYVCFALVVCVMISDVAFAETSEDTFDGIWERASGYIGGSLGKLIGIGVTVAGWVNREKIGTLNAIVATIVGVGLPWGAELMNAAYTLTF